MRLFDLHCDTIGECHNQKKDLSRNDLHISLEKASYLSHYAQVFAIWIPDEKRGAHALRYFDEVYNTYKDACERNKHLLLPCRSADELFKARSEGKTAAVLAVESGAVLGGKAENLNRLYEKGVRLITLTWNAENEIGSGCFDAVDKGLTAFGKACVKKMEQLGMVVDVSHLSEKGFFDVADIAEKPFIASHSNADIVDNKYGRARNLTDAQLKIIFERSGLVGINLCEPFLGNDDTSAEAVYRHISHMLNMENASRCIALGCDFDGCTVNSQLAGIDKLSVLYDYLLKKGISEDTAENIFYDNAFHFFSDMLK